MSLKFRKTTIPVTNTLQDLNEINGKISQMSINIKRLSSNNYTMKTRLLVS